MAPPRGGSRGWDEDAGPKRTPFAHQRGPGQGAVPCGAGGGQGLSRGLKREKKREKKKKK